MIIVIMASVKKYMPIAVALSITLLVAIALRGSSRTESITADVEKGPIKQEVLASGNVASPSSINLQFQTAGKITFIGADEGGRVQKGQLLARLDASILSAQLAQAQGALEAQQSQLASLRAGTRPEQLAVTESQVMSDETALAQARIALINAVQGAYTAGDDAVRNKVDQFISNPRSTNPQITFLTPDLEAVNILISMRMTSEDALRRWQNEISSLPLERSSEGGESAQVYLSDISKLLLAANTALNAAIPSPQASQTTLSGWITNVGTARSAVITAATTLTSALTTYRNAVTLLEKDRRTLILQQAGLTQEAIATQLALVSQAQAQVSAIRAQISQTEIRAPFDGIITNANYEQGETVTSSNVVVTMMPASRLQIDINLSEDNVADVRIGDPVRIELDALPDELLLGTIRKIDPAETVIGGAIYYRTIVLFDTLDDRVKSGMTANVWIETGASDAALKIPASAIEKREGSLFVRIESDGVLKERKIKTGLRGSDGMIEVIQGLSEGERVVIGE